MKPTHTKFISRYEAEIMSTLSLQADNKNHYTRLTALISINSPDSGDPKEAELRSQDDGPPNVTGFWNPLMLQFHDIDPKNCGEDFLKKYVLFDDAMANKILDYLLEMEQAQEPMACWAHCQAGISRSAGVSKFIAEIYNLYWPKDYCHANLHVYNTLRAVYNTRVLTNKLHPGFHNEHRIKAV
jgi:predicted protein tyrosine phosphatase